MCDSAETSVQFYHRMVANGWTPPGAGWQSMDTAPKDREILVRRHNDVRFEYALVWWGDDDMTYPWHNDYTAYPTDRLDGWHEIPK